MALDRHRAAVGPAPETSRIVKIRLQFHAWRRTENGDRSDRWLDKRDVLIFDLSLLRAAEAPEHLDRKTKDLLVKTGVDRSVSALVFGVVDPGTPSKNSTLPRRGGLSTHA
jgi:hypothetical protein